MSSIAFNDISVVVQGPVIGKSNDVYEKRFTLRCLESIRNNLPGAEIILSTWKGSDIEGLPYDILVENEDPGEVFLYGYNDMLKNTNRQIFSTKMGLAKATQKYALKLRSDTFLCSNDFLKYFDLYNERINDWKIFSKRILACTVVSQNPRKNPVTLNPSDWFHFGLIEDIKNLWDIPLLPKPEVFQKLVDGKIIDLVKYKDIFCYSPEQYIWVSLLRKYGQVSLNKSMEISDQLIELTELTFTNNLVFLEPEQIKIYSLKYDHKDMPDIHYSHEEWIELYNRKILQRIASVKTNERTYNTYKNRSLEINGINTRDISVIIQGPVLGTPLDPYMNRFTMRSIESVKKHLPGSEIILSTWDGANIDNLDVDKVVFNNDPGAFYIDQHNSIMNNVNRQIVSTKNGLFKSTKEYSIKLRSDFELTGNEFLNYLNAFPQRCDEVKIFKKRVLASTINSTNPRKAYLMPYHISDWFFVGLSEDLLKLWDIPLSEEPKNSLFYKTIEKPFLYQFDNCFHRFTPEQYIWGTFIKKYYNISFDHMVDFSNGNVEMTDIFIANNLIFLEPEKLNIKPLKFEIKSDLNGVYTHLEWCNLFTRFCFCKEKLPINLPEPIMKNKDA